MHFHGPAELYASSYSDQELHCFAFKFRGWVAEGFKEWAFFNNAIHGYAPQDAQRFEHFCKSS